MKKECNHGTLKKCVSMGMETQYFPSVEFSFNEITFYRCEQCNKEFKNLVPTNHDIMQACIDQIEESDFEVGYIDPEFIEKFKCEHEFIAVPRNMYNNDSVSKCNKCGYRP